MATSQALVEKELLIWARETRGLDLPLAAKRIGTTLERLLSWEEGTARPTVAQLRKIAQVYARPIGVFFLSEPPSEGARITDFRLPVDTDQPASLFAPALDISPELLLQIRLARERRADALDLAKLTQYEIPEFSERATLEQDGEQVAFRLRRQVGVEIAVQHRWRPGEAFGYWRAAIEKIGVLVFQTGAPGRTVDVEEARGFSISEFPLPAIVVNGKDSLSARCFTLMHELAHLALRRGGLCDLHQQVGSGREEDRVEIFCNRVAGAILVPESALRAEPLVRRGPQSVWPTDDLQHLARRFGVSREVVVRRLVILGLATNEFYQEWRTTETVPVSPPTETRDIRIPYARRVVQASGRLYAGLVLRAFSEDNITASEVSRYLGMKLKHLDAMEREVFESRFVT